LVDEQISFMVAAVSYNLKGCLIFWVLTQEIIICDIYIAPYSARSWILLSLTQTSFHPAHISTPKGVYNACCHYRRKALLKYIAIESCQIHFFNGWVNQLPHDSSRSLEPTTVQLQILVICSSDVSAYLVIAVSVVYHNKLS